MTKNKPISDAKVLSSPHEPVYDVAMMLLNSIPAMGPAIAWFASGVFTDPGQAVRDRFILELAKKVDTLLDREQIQRALQQEPVPALLSHAMSIASRSFGQEKLEALQHATINGIFHDPHNVNLADLVFGVLDRLTNSHISLLKEIAKQSSELKAHVGWEQAKLIGVNFKPTSDGMKSPARVLPFNEDEKFVDEFDVRTNEILLNDLVGIGLIAQRYGTPPSILDWSTTPSENLPAYAYISTKGNLVLDRISEARHS